MMDSWELKYRAQVSLLPSLKYFNASYMSLSSPHPSFVAASSPFEVRKAVVVARMISGRYRTDCLARHWSQSNPGGLCLLPGCTGDSSGNLEHILLYCPALQETRSNLTKLWYEFMVQRSHLFPLVLDLTSKEESFMQLLMDPSSIPAVRAANSMSSDVLSCCFYLSRTWVSSHHLRRTKLQKIWNLT